MKENQKRTLEEQRAKHGAEYVSFDPSTGTVNIALYRKDLNYKKLQKLLPNYNQSFLDQLYLHDRADIELSDSLYDTIAENDTPQLASKVFSVIGS